MVEHLEELRVDRRLQWLEISMSDRQELEIGAVAAVMRATPADGGVRVRRTSGRLVKISRHRW